MVPNFSSAWSVFWNFVGTAFVGVFPAALFLIAAGAVGEFFGGPSTLPRGFLSLVVGASVYGAVLWLMGLRQGRRDRDEEAEKAERLGLRDPNPSAG